MSEVHDNPEIIYASLLDSEKCLWRIRQGHSNTRFFGFVFNRKLNVAVFLTNFSHCVDGVTPNLLVIHLARVVISILSRPKLHVAGIEHGRRFNGLLYTITCAQAKFGVRIGECTPRVFTHIDVWSRGTAL